MVLAGNGDPPRQIHLDGRSSPEGPTTELDGVVGGTVARDTLVVGTTGFNERGLAGRLLTPAKRGHAHHRTVSSA